MPDKWYKSYKKMIGFIARHPEIEIGEKVTSLPAQVRPRFYEHFNAIRDALIVEKLPIVLDAASELSQNYLRIESVVKELLEIETIDMDVSLQKLLHSPNDEIRRGIFDPLFELLKGKIKDEQFERQAMQNTVTHFRSLFHSGYEKWVVLALMKLIEADKLYQVKVRNFTSSEEQTRMGDGTSRENIPPVEESQRIIFNNGRDVILTVPDLIVRSPQANKYVGIRSHYGKALATALELSQKRRWYTLDSLTPINPDITLVYIDSNPKNIALVADFNHICKPDIVIITKELNKWYEKEGLGSVKPYHYSLKPTLGTYVISREAVGELKSEDREEDLHIISAGYDAASMQPVSDAISKANYNQGN